MIESNLVSARNAVEQELKLSQFQRIDPKRKAFLRVRLAQLTRDIQAVGFSETEVEKNDVNVGHGQKQTNQTSFLIPPASWMSEDAAQKQPRDTRTHQERVTAYREEANRRAAVWEGKNK
jgi:hypothetical protein